MKQYLDLLRHVKETGTYKGDRTGTGTYSVFGYQMRFDLSQGLPLVTTKRCHMPSIVNELLWFMRGLTDVKWLQQRGVRIWNEWATEDGELGPVYGEQWRSWKGANGETFDQLKTVIEDIKTNPDSRRLIVSAWNPSVLPTAGFSPQWNAEHGKQALPPCHCLFQFYVADGKLSCQLYQRSADIFLGVPFNIASYALLTMMIARECRLEVGEFIHTLGDAHIYSNHMEQVDEQLIREPRPLPTVAFSPHVDDIFKYVEGDIKLHDYDPHPHIKAPVAV